MGNALRRRGNDHRSATQEASAERNKMNLLELAKQDLESAEYNLHRARHAARWVDVGKPYGRSSEILDEIIAEYEQGVRQAEETVKQAEGLGE